MIRTAPAGFASFALFVAAAAIGGCAAPRSKGPPRATSFQELASFECPYVESIVDPNAGASAVAIPDSIRALDGRRVELEGYVEGAMFPLAGRPESSHEGAATSSVVSRSTGTFATLLTSQPFQCCMHEPPRVSETILVELPEGSQIVGAPHKIVRVAGTLRIAPEIDTAHVLHGIYRIEATAVEDLGAVRPHGK